MKDYAELNKQNEKYKADFIDYLILQQDYSRLEEYNQKTHNKLKEQHLAELEEARIEINQRI